MSTRNKRFNNAMLHLFGIPEDRIKSLSDAGASAERLYDSLESAHTAEAWHQSENPCDEALVDEMMLLMCSILLKATGHAETVPTLILIAQNGSDRERSITTLRRLLKCRQSAARRRYFRHRKYLTAMFVWTNENGPQIDLLL